MRMLSIPTTTHGRLVVEDADGTPAGLIVAFHGYAQSPDETLTDVRKIPGTGAWTVASVQGLHRFYNRNSDKVIASWMTRQDRDDAIADNVAYVDRAIDAVGAAGPIVFVGFSQGASMAYRAAVLGSHRAAGVIALGGDIPPEVKSGEILRPWPAVLIGAGERDTWFTPAKAEADAAFLAAQQVPHEVVRFTGAHEWTDEFRAAAARWLQRVIQAAATSSA
jgi:predicted esterase